LFKSGSYFGQPLSIISINLLAFAQQYNLNEEMTKLISSTFGGGMGRLRLSISALVADL